MQQCPVSILNAETGFFVFMFRPGVQKCCRALSPSGQKLGVRERDYAATYQCLVHNFKCNIMAKLVCLHYYKFLRSAKTHRTFSPLV